MITAADGRRAELRGNVINGSERRVSRWNLHGESNRDATARNDPFQTKEWL